MHKAHALSPFRILSCLAILVWALMMGALLKRSFISPLTHQVDWRGAATAEAQPGESWMGIYLHDKKIGYSTTHWEKEGLDLRLVERTVMELMVMGQPQSVNLSASSLLDPALNLKSFRFHLTSDQVNFSAEGEVKDKRMRVRLAGIGEEQEIEIPLPRSPYLSSHLRLFLKSQDLREGSQYQVALFDPVTLQLEDLRIEVGGKERLRIGAQEVEAIKVRQTFKGITIHSWIDEGGEVLREESPMGFVLVKEEKESAILKGRGSGKGEDLIALAAVPSSVKIPDPRAIRILRIRLENLSPEGLDLDGGRQRLRGNVLEIQREDLDFKTPTLPIHQPSLEPYLQPTPFIQSDHPELKEMAGSILQGEGDSLVAAKRLAAWVFEKIEKRPILSIPSSLEVLHSRVGDCNEHTILFVGLARAAGLPAKVEAGLVYARGKFYYHAWPEVYVGRWIAIDPTLNQFPADATHVRLVEGGLERQTELLRLMGKVSLEILGVQ